MNEPGAISVIASGRLIVVRDSHQLKQFLCIWDTLSGTFIVWSDLQPLKIFSARPWIPSGISISTILAQFINECLLIWLTDDGILKSLSFSQPAKHSALILVMLSGSLIDVIEEQPLNAHFPISVTFSGILIVRSLLQHSNALSPISLRDVGSTTASIFWLSLKASLSIRITPSGIWTWLRVNFLASSFVNTSLMLLEVSGTLVSGIFTATSSAAEFSDGEAFASGWGISTTGVFSIDGLEIGSSDGVIFNEEKSTLWIGSWLSAGVWADCSEEIGASCCNASFETLKPFVRSVVPVEFAGISIGLTSVSLLFSLLCTAQGASIYWSISISFFLAADSGCGMNGASGSCVVSTAGSASFSTVGGSGSFSTLGFASSVDWWALCWGETPQGL